jgi:hypothetical protein
MAMQKKNLDDNLPFQAMVGIFLHIYSRGFFKKELISFDYGWAWFSCYNMSIGTNNKS